MDYDPYTAEWITDKDTNRKRKFFTNDEEQERLRSRAKAMMAQVRQQREAALDDVPLIQRQWRMHLPNKQGSYPYGFWAIQKKIDDDYFDEKTRYERYRNDPYTPKKYAQERHNDDATQKWFGIPAAGPFTVPEFDRTQPIEQQLNVK